MGEIKGFEYITGFFNTSNNTLGPQLLIINGDLIKIAYVTVIFPSEVSDNHIAKEVLPGESVIVSLPVSSIIPSQGEETLE